MAFVGNWEPLAFRRRRGTWPHADIEARYEAEHSPETIGELKTLGVNFVITHFFKGFGLAAEAEEIAKTAKFIQDCHEAGIGVGTYVSSNFFYETFLAEEPDAAEWAGVKYDGTKATYFQQYFRWQFCYSNPAYLKYIKKVVDKAVDVGADLLHFDNFSWMPNHDYCHCRHCVEAFRAYIAEHLTPAQRRELLGFETTDHILPPPGIDKIRLDAEVVRDPLMRLWIAFRADVIDKTWRAICAHARSRRADIKMEFNGEALACIYNHTKMGVDFDRMLPEAFAFWGEDAFGPKVHPNGCIGGRWRSMKMAEAYGSHFFGYAFAGNGQDEAQARSNRLYFAEHLAFNHNCVADVGAFDATPTTPDFRSRRAEMQLLRRNESLLVDTESPAKVAVFRNFPSQAYCGITTQLAAYSVEQMLFLRSIPFDILMDSHLDRLSRYQVVVLAGQLCLDGRQREAFAQYVAAGGALILIGRAGKYDQWGMRARRDLAEQLGLDIADGLEPTSQQLGGGTVHYRPIALPKVVQQAIEAGKFPRYDDDWAYYPSSLWDEPPDADELAEMIHQATGGPLIEHDGPNTVICNLRRKGNTTLVHLLQYDSAQQLENITVTLAGFESTTSVRRVDFDNCSPRPVAFEADGAKLRIDVGALDVYALLIVE